MKLFERPNSWKGAGFSKNYGDPLSSALESLSKEIDPKIQSEALLGLAEREEAQGNLLFAQEAYVWLLENGAGESRSKAQERLDVLSGKGRAALRAEHLLRGFARDASDPVMLLAMGVGGGVYRATKLAAMGRLAGSAGYFGRGIGLNLAASSAGLVLEGAAFTATARAGRGELPWGYGSKGELLSSYLMLGGLKFMGAVAGQATSGISNRKVATWLSQTGMYGGIMLGHGLEATAGFREWRPGGIEWTEGLLLLMQFNVSGNLLARMGGENYRRWERQLEIHADHMANGGSFIQSSPANDGNYPRIEPAANGPHREALEQIWALASGDESWSHDVPTGNGPFRQLELFANHGDHESASPAMSISRSKFHEELRISAEPKLRSPEESVVPVPRSREETRPMMGCQFRCFFPSERLVQFTLLEPNYPRLSGEAVYSVRHVLPQLATVVLALDTASTLTPERFPAEVRLDLDGSFSFTGKEKFILKASEWNDGEMGMPDLDEVRQGRPLEVPQKRHSIFAIGTPEQIQRWYGKDPGARLSQIDVFRPPGRTAAWTLTFQDLGYPGGTHLVLLKLEEAEALGLADREGRILENAAVRAQELALVERSRQPTYGWGEQAAARLVPHGMHNLDFTLYLDDISPPQDAHGRLSPFLVLGRGEEAFGHEYFRDPQVSREHLQIFFPEKLWISGKSAYVAAANLSKNMMWSESPGGLSQSLAPRDQMLEGESPFRKLRHGDKVGFGPYSVTIHFQRGPASVKGEFQAREGDKINAPEIRTRPMENIYLSPGQVYELGRNSRPYDGKSISIAISQPVISRLHARLLFSKPDPEQAGNLLVSTVASQSADSGEARSFVDDEGRLWSGPDLAGADWDLAIPPMHIQELLAPPLWIHAKNGDVRDWFKLPSGSTYVLEPGDLIALGNLGKPEQGAVYEITSGGQLGHKFYNFPWDLRNAVIYQFGENPEGAILSLYRFDED